MTKRSSTQSGTTLLELLVGLVILALLVTLTMQLARSSQLMFQQGERRQQIADTAASLSFLRTQLENAAPAIARVDSGRAIIAFDGAADAIAFYSAAPLEAEEPALQKVRFFLQDNALHMSRSPATQPDAGRDRVLISGVDRIEFRYGRLQANGAISYSPAWKDQTTMPAIIAVEFFADDSLIAPALFVRPKISRQF